MARVSPLAGEQGAVVVTVAIALPVLILFASFAIDVGNWFVHARHLQTQADAGALAAAGDFRYPCDDARIESRAREYAGVEGGGYNHQVGGGNVEFALNASSYPEQPSKTDPNPVGGPPCETGKIDVKLTETALPPFFSVAGIVPFINAHARVQVFTKQFISGALPVAVPDDNPRSASVTFVDEETGETLATRQLTRAGNSGELAIWSNASEPLPLSVESERIGMRVNLGGAGSSACGEPLVECYDAGSPGGILFVRGFSMAGSGAQPGPPLARSVHFSEAEPLEAGDCVDPYFSAGGCSVGLHADVDFGPCEQIGKVGAELKVVAGGASYAMERVGCPEGTSASEWETVGRPVPVPAEAGPFPVTLEWAETKGEEGGNKCKEGGGNKCTGSFGVVQRSFAASDERSGPIRLAQLSEGGEAGADSLERCSEVQASCTHELVATIGVQENLSEKNATSVEAPLVHLRVTSASQNQSLDCDPALPNLREEIAQGCSPKYAKNLGTACPSQSELWASAEPWDCVAIQTGKAKGQVWAGMNERILGSSNPASCTSPNEWSRFPTFKPEDPRIVPVFITPFGTFSGTGNETVPVTDFATFYVTGWAGEGNGHSSQSICPGDDEAEPGTIVGHFIKYVQALNEGEASEEPCDFSSRTPCVAVLTE